MLKCLFKNLIIFAILTLGAQCAFCYSLTYDELQKTIQSKIKQQTNFDDFSIKISGIPYEKITTADPAFPKIEIISQNQTFQPNSFKRVIVKDSKNNIVKSFSINVQTFIYKKVLTANSQIPFGMGLNASNTTIERKEISRYLDKVLFDLPKDSIASRNYPKGAIILSNGVKQKAVMLKNSTIDIVFLSQKGLKITVQGKALKDGALGETILVKSDKYNKTYNAIVNSNRQATVRI